MKKAIVIFVMVLIVVAGMVAYFVYGDYKTNLSEFGMFGGLILVVGFAVVLAVKRIRSVRLKQPAEDELSKRVMKRAASTAYYISLYSWLALMFVSDTLEIPVHTLIGFGIMLMAVEFALAWVYFNYFGKVNE